ncbi:hypothetical protein BGX31_011092 [Mortierella sp. GBA43]|nr:hypothetical protein BGX31_011092 [Mortierella sp. GBA43]
MDDTATATTMSMARSLRSEGISIGAISEKAEDDGGGDDQRQDDNVEDRGKEGDAERFGDDSLAAGMIGRYEPEVRKHPEDDRYGQLEPIWWALAIGFALQLLWIAAVWLFSRGGICAA